MGDRFAQEGRAQLSAVMQARNMGIEVCPVWNKSNREHNLTKTHPDDVRREADAAVRELGWDGPYHVDADHIGMKTVDRFLAGSDFFTLDVADFVGKPAEPGKVEALKSFLKPWGPQVRVPGIDRPVELDGAALDSACAQFLGAMGEAGSIYRHLATIKGKGTFITEVSVDETDTPQNPGELLLILAMLAVEGVPVQTIAPKFTGRFNKGVDYVGDLVKFEQEFDEDLHILAFAIREFKLPGALKLSVHSGSDKFSLYPIINRLVKRHGCGLHVKTAGTTWLEEVIGLAEAGGNGLEMAKEIYLGAIGRFTELTGPYASVIDIDPARLPDAEAVAAWDSATFVAALRHEPGHPGYNGHFRQLIHVAFKVAAEMGPRYLEALVRHRTVIERNVTYNLLERHLTPIFGGLT
jgi:tagaturonate epimerase